MSVELREIMNRPGQKRQARLWRPLCAAKSSSTGHFPVSRAPKARPARRLAGFPGGMVGIVGRSGSGKTTLSALPAGPDTWNRGRHPHRRPQYPRHRSGLSARPERRCAAGAVPVPRHDQGQYPHGRAHRFFRGCGGGAQCGGADEFIQHLPQALLTPNGGRRGQSVRRAEAAISIARAPCWPPPSFYTSTKPPARWIQKAKPSW